MDLFDEIEQTQTKTRAKDTRKAGGDLFDEVESISSGEPAKQEKTMPKVSREQLLRMQASMDYPAEDTTLGALGAGFTRGMESVGEGIVQRGLDVYEFFGGDASQTRKDIDISRKIQAAKFKPTQEESPVAATVGEIGGTIAAFPVPASTIPKAMAVGGAFGATQYLEEGEGMGTFAKNVAVDASLGGLGQAAAPYIQKGFNKGQALFSGIYKKATGVDPRPVMFLPDGGLSIEGTKALDELGMTQDEFARIYSSLDDSLNPVQAARQARAKEAGIDLTQAQVTKDFAQQEAEQTLKAGIGRESEAARQLAEAQQQQMKGAADKFTESFGDVSQGRAETGRIAQEGVIDIETAGRKKVSDLYTAAKETEGPIVIIEREGILDAIDDSVINRPIDDKVLNTLESLMAKYGLVDGEVVKSGRFNHVLTSDGAKVKFKGEVQPLSLNNQEEFRQGLNRLYPSDESGAIKQIIKQLDDSVDATVSSLPTGSAKTTALKAARDEARNQKKIFSQKDIVQNLVDYKKGTSSLKISPDNVMDNIYLGKEGLGNLKKIRSTLLSKPTEKSKAAWKSIQAQGVADLFANAINPVNGDISGARLKSAIKRLGNGKIDQGERKLKLLLGEKHKEFKFLVDAIGDATIPLKGTTNTSGTAYKMLNFMTRIGSVGTLGIDAVLPLANKAKDSFKSKGVLRNIENAAPEKVKQAVKANDALIDAMISLGASRTAQTQ